MCVCVHTCMHAKKIISLLHSFLLLNPSLIVLLIHAFHYSIIQIPIISSDLCVFVKGNLGGSTGRLCFLHLKQALFSPLPTQKQHNVHMPSFHLSPFYTHRRSFWNKEQICQMDPVQFIFFVHYETNAHSCAIQM